MLCTLLEPTSGTAHVNGYDIVKQEMADQTIEIYRNLHCWEGRITWIPSGFREGFYFRINIKALPEIKLEKGGTGLGTPFY